MLLIKLLWYSSAFYPHQNILSNPYVHGQETLKYSSEKDSYFISTAANKT